MTTDRKKPTSGPWIARDGSTTGREVVGQTARGTDRVVARCGGPEREANADLISAAPDLLEALVAVAAAIGEWSRPTSANGMIPAGETHPLCVVVTKARAAIDKAEGRSHD